MKIATVREMLDKTVYRKVDVEGLLDPKTPSWVKYDTELGYLPTSIVMQDGLDYSNTTYTYMPQGYRKHVNYPTLPCRITTYGDSYTQCQQTSDGETWQEMLAAHLGEPIRNFGNGGIGVYQSYGRMRREEPEHGGDHVILNIFVDDHIRNLDSARWVRTALNDTDKNDDQVYPLHGLPWIHLRYDLEKDTFVEKPAICKSEDDLRALCDPNNYRAAFENDQIARLFAIQQGAEVDDLDEFYALAKKWNLDIDLEDPARREQDAMRLHQVYGQMSTVWLLEERLLPWFKQENKKLFIVLSFCMGTLANYLNDGSRMDGIFLDWLKNSGIPFSDLCVEHKKDFDQFKISLQEYQKRFYIMAKVAAVFGHYSPAGNHFTTFAIKDSVVDWLEPKPQAYAHLQK